MDIRNCTCCPHECGTDRYNGIIGRCQRDSKPHIAQICIHKGEEPVLGGPNGVVNVFFTGCNLKCVYCQNHEISQDIPTKEYNSIRQVVSIIASLMCQHEVNTVGFVSPSHNVFNVKAIIDLLRKRGYNPTIIYNTNGYDKVETLRELEDYVNIYLPDYKYAIDETGEKYSGIKHYSSIALKAIGEMYRQKGSRLTLNNDGICESGLIIRHLVLPNNIDNSIEAVKNIAMEISPRVKLSLMSQYYPDHLALTIPELNRKITEEEYKKVFQR